ncbi:MAG TPA: UDP-N-acetylmuramoyl-tripeptide--D-alanyl-D-alanine ligase [Gaiellaceae bacterium]|nr:UDP-N-acetylmuramoyl-tripeptide--D-alanyl-D-alanine ligase [Gaiellaceae bacterium]
MIPLLWSEVTALKLGVLEGDGVITSIKADSRAAGPGDLFIALNAGIEFVEDARAHGAATLVPDDQEAALAALASLVRSKSDAQVVAVVGSAGKTTTKDILGALCAPHVPTVRAERSLNNEIGLPLTVCRLEPETRVLVAEMGMRGVGQIAALCAIARPSIAVIPHIGPEHLELLGSVERVAEANAEVVAALPPGGVAVVPAQVEALEPYLDRRDVTLRRFDPEDVEVHDGVTRFTVGDDQVDLELPFTQRHLAVNTLAALHAYVALGLPLDRVADGVPTISLSPWRGEEIALPGDGFVVNDAYNANPDSMRAALEHLAERAGARRKVAVLGEMAELGEASESYHRAIGALAAELDIEVVGVGERARAYGPVAWAANSEDAVDVARGLLGAGDAVLVKASRAVGLEGIADEITNIARAWSLS